jgi:hypothetical protein
MELDGRDERRSPSPASRERGRGCTRAIGRRASIPVHPDCTGGDCRPKKRLSALADCFLGYRDTENLAVIQKGPVPYEVIIGRVCEQFGCVPDVAERQDPLLIQGIIEARTIERAIEAANDTKQGGEWFVKNPSALPLLLEAMSAQLGMTIDETAARQQIELMQPPREDGDSSGTSDTD